MLLAELCDSEVAVASDGGGVVTFVCCNLLAEALRSRDSSGPAAC